MTEETGNDLLELPTQALREAAFKLFGETKEMRQVNIIEVRNALKDFDCGGFDTSDATIVRFLRGKKYDVGKTVKCITETIKFNKDHPQWTQNLKASEFDLFTKVLLILPQRDKENRVIILLRPSVLIKQLSAEYLASHEFILIRFNIWMNQALTTHPEINVHGAVFILSTAELSIWDCTTVMKVAKIDERAANMHYLFACAALRVGGIYLFDEPFYVRWLFNLVLAFMSSKMISRFHVSGQNYGVLKDLVKDTNTLPKCLGGDAELDYDSESNQWMRNLFSSD